MAGGWPIRRRTWSIAPYRPPTSTARIVRRTARLLARRDADLAGDDEPDALALAQAEAVQTPLALPVPAPEALRAGRRRCAFVDGFSLHADTAVAAADRAALKRLARYLLRPAISADRVAVRPDGRVEVRFRRPDPTGRTSWVTDGPAETASMLARRLDWAALLARVFGADVTTCPHCGDDLVIAFLSAPNIVAGILDPSRPPRRRPARRPRPRSACRRPRDRTVVGAAIGFHAPRGHDVCDVVACPQLEPALDAVLVAIRAAAGAPTAGGLLRGDGEIHAVVGEGGAAHVVLDVPVDAAAAAALVAPRVWT